MPRSNVPLLPSCVSFAIVLGFGFPKLDDLFDVKIISEFVAGSSEVALHFAIFPATE